MRIIYFKVRLCNDKYLIDFHNMHKCRNFVSLHMLYSLNINKEKVEKSYKYKVRAKLVVLV